MERTGIILEYNIPACGSQEFVVAADVKEKPSRLACAPSQPVKVANGLPLMKKNLCNHFSKSV